MSTRITVQDYQDGKLIRLSPPLSSKRRMLHYANALVCLGGLVIWYYFYKSVGTEFIVVNIFLIVVAVVCLIAFVRLINKATEVEKLFINKTRLDIIQSSLLKKKITPFEVAAISDLQFGERVHYVDHPLKGNTFDYLGFQTEQQVICNLHSEGLASFHYRGQLIKFGKDLASWEFEEINEIIFNQTGIHLATPHKSELEDLFPEIDY